jgi:hypothetical protein
MAFSLAGQHLGKGGVVDPLHARRGLAATALKARATPNAPPGNRHRTAPILQTSTY